MLSRASSDAGTRIRRSKSTSTVYRHPPSAPQPLDQDVAQQHAVAAATTAFVRAHASDAAERAKNRSLELSRTKSNASRKSLKSQGSHFPPRESSLRSLHPQKGGQVAGVSSQTRAPMTTEKLPPFQVTPSVDRPTSAQPSITFSENMRPSSQPKLHRPNASSSVASQQVRKARSMYYASSIQTGSPIARPPVKYLTTPPPLSVSPALDASPALLPARATAVSPLVSPRLTVTVAPDETVDTARDKYLKDFQQRQVKHKPSLFLAPFKKRQDKGKLRKEPPLPSGAVSYDSHQTLMDPTPDFSLTDFQPQKEKKEKRSFSNSLKNKFKKVFRRTSNNTTTLPVQQIEASRDYFGDYTVHVNPPPRAHGGSEIPSPDDETLQRIRSRTPSLEGRRPALAKLGSLGSIRSNHSIHSETDISIPSTSRVTSWSNSSAGCTLTQRDIKRLTVIHEAKDSISSDAGHNIAAMSPKRKPPPIPSFTTFREPMPMERFMEEVPTPIDPKRVFSALMKEIDASKIVQAETVPSDRNPGEESDIFLSSASKDMPSTANRELHSSASGELRASFSSDQRPPSRQRPESVAASSIKSFGRAIRSTIRTVTPSEQTSSPIPDRTTSVRGAVRIPRPDTATSSNTTTSELQENENEDNTSSTINFKMQPRRSHPPTRDSQVEQSFTPTAKQIEQRVQKSKGRWKTPLEENHIPFFPPPTKQTFTVANIAQKTHSHNHSNEQIAVELLTETKRKTVIEEQQPANTPVSPRPRSLFSPLSPSVYSRNTDGVSILPNDSVMSLDGANDEDEREGGSAVILTSRAVKSFVIGTPTTKKATHSARSSRDWKAWLSHEVAELENLPQQDITIHEQYSTHGGHRREFTQIEDEDTTVIVRESVELSIPQQEAIQVEMQDTIAVEPSIAKEVSDDRAAPEHAPPDSLEAPKSSEESHTSRKVPPRPGPSPLPRREPMSSFPSERFSLSRPGERSSLSRPKLDTPSLERMNDRFPYIETGRRSSNNSTKFSRLSRSTPDSGSSLNSKATPSPKVYSDFSAPSTNRTSKYGPNSRSKRCEVIDNEKENKKENIVPSLPQKKALDRPELGSTQSLPIGRPKSLQPLTSSSCNSNPSTLAQYTTTVGNVDVKLKRNPDPTTTLTRPRVRAQIRPISPSKLTARPKSAFDLRGTHTPPLAPSPLKLPVPGSDSPRKRERYAGGVGTSIQRKQLGRKFEGDTLRIVQESPWAVSGPPSLRSSLEENLRRPPLHIKHSSSVLALNKEPSPGAEEIGIDRILGDGDRPNKDGRVGSVTPGQRMAERFLRERTGGSGAGSPVSIVSAAEGAESMRDREGLTPAFL